MHVSYHSFSLVTLGNSDCSYNKQGVVQSQGYRLVLASFFFQVSLATTWVANQISMFSSH